MEKFTFLTSLLYLMRAIAITRAHASTGVTDLMLVKNSTHHLKIKLKTVSKLT